MPATLFVYVNNNDMSNRKFKDLNEAQAAYDALVADQTKAIEEAVKAAVKSKDDEIAALTKRAEDAEKVAEDAVERVNSGSNIYVSFEKKKYKVVFGVDGKSKEEVAADKKLVKELIEKGSAAIVAVN